MKELPTNATDLARDLGYSMKKLAAMTEAHGADEMLMRLQREWKRKVPDRPRLLARDSSHGYTAEPAMALAEEPEAVSEVEQDEITKQARERREHEAVIEIASASQLPLLARLELAKKEALRRGIDISRDLRVIEQRFERENRRLAG